MFLKYDLILQYKADVNAIRASSYLFLMGMKAFFVSYSKVALKDTRRLQIVRSIVRELHS